MQSLCSRCYKLHFNPRSGIHTHVPILFDYFHLSAITTTIHGSLLCLIPPYVFDRPNVRRTSLFSFLFAQDLSHITTDQLNPNLLERAYHLHNNICEILLSSYESLQDFYEKMIQHLPANEQKAIHHHQNCRQRLKELFQKLKNIDDVHSIDNLAHAHIAQCSAENIMLWCQFIETFGLHEITENVLAKDYHFKRVKRLSECFFLRETSRINLLINESDIYNDLHEIVRNSSYFSRLPHLPIECIELDGVPDTLPILLEEIYSPTEQSSTATILSSLKSKTNNENSASQTIQNLSKLRSNLSHSASGKLNETTSNSVSNSPSISHSKSQKQQQTKPSPTNNNSNNTSSTPTRHQSAKSFSLFRNHTLKNTNPVVALSNEPLVKLTSIRKVDQDKIQSSPTLKSHMNSSFGLFPNQSDTDINYSHQKKTNPSYFSTKSSHHSLPNVSLKRSNSISTTNSNLIDSPIVPNFLCSTSDKTNDDVFLTNDQDNIVAASTFGDSSMKSKVLRASYRGKAHTMDRRTTKPTAIRSLSTSAAYNNTKHSTNIQTKYIITNTDDDKISPTDRPVNYSLDSVLSFTLELEQKSTDNIQRRHTISTNDIDPLLLNGLTDDENQLNSIEKLNDNYSSSILTDDNNDQSINLENNKQENSLEYDRLQNNLINSQTIEFVVHKEKLKQLLSSKYSSNFMFFSDFSSPISMMPYFSQEIMPFNTNGNHLIICVHGLDGNSGDLRLMKTYLELCLPSHQLDFLMSSSNQSTTFDDIDVMVKQLIDEIDIHIERYGLKPQRISFIGHSLGNLIIRAAVSHQRFEPYRTLLYTYLSLSGPHLGTLFNTSGLVNIGMWLMQKWKKSCSLSQMSFSDHIDPKQTYLYKLSKQPFASPQDRYVPFHSARIEVCKAALKDTVYGSIYVEMISNLLEPILRNPSITFVRYNAFHNIPSGTNNIIGRAAHIAILDSELFVEKLILISAAKYFK
ncbi:unnamed protein product [Rotaria sp. Silwood2]|nr:unnamed protein product [Rotaria sp. Silwood2]